MAMQQVEGPDSESTAAKPGKRRRYRSLFWAIVLIGAGVILLLYNLDVLTATNMAMLALVWPVLLIGIGVDLLVGRRSLALGAAVGVVTVGVIIALMLIGPAAGWISEPEVITETLSTPVGQATSAQVELNLGGYSTNVHALESATGPERPLLYATVSHRGKVELVSEETGGTDKTVVLESKGDRWWWQWLDGEDMPPWDIGLDAGVPLQLKAQTSSGSSVLDLSGLLLAGLVIGSSSGDTSVILPAGGSGPQAYTVALDASSGDMEAQAPAGAKFQMSVDMSSGDAEVTLGEDSDVELVFNGSSGQFTLDLPAGQAFRLEVQDVSSGDVKRPSGMVQVSEGDDEDEGIWETQGYATAAHKVNVMIDNMSSGGVVIRQGN
jgi:hypothetical protein